MSTSSVGPDAEADVDPSSGARATGDASHASSNEATPKTRLRLRIRGSSVPDARSFALWVLFAGFEAFAEVLDQRELDVPGSFAAERDPRGFFGLGDRDAADGLADLRDRGRFHAELAQAHADEQDRGQGVAGHGAAHEDRAASAHAGFHDHADQSQNGGVEKR